MKLSLGDLLIKNRITYQIRSIVQAEVGELHYECQKVYQMINDESEYLGPFMNRSITLTESQILEYFDDFSRISYHISVPPLELFMEQDSIAARREFFIEKNVILNSP